MLAQHIVTRPVFEALFENYSFVKNNPVSKYLENILSILDRKNIAEDSEQLKKFYDSVRERCKIATTAEDRQKIIIELYEKFFKTAAPLTVERLGIVYTPVEVVDFILHSVNDVLKKNFGKTLSSKGVNILDPFVGTGTFLVRLIQSDLINKKDLLRKYRDELHANEVILLAYYIAAINIENAFHDAAQLDDYLPFNGICFTDTFQAYEQNEVETFSFALEENSARVKKQRNTQIEVIVGNPPYSVGQRSANDNAQNIFYPKLERRISETYAAKTNATNKNSLISKLFAFQATESARAALWVLSLMPVGSTARLWTACENVLSKNFPRFMFSIFAEISARKAKLHGAKAEKFSGAVRVRPFPLRFWLKILLTSARRRFFTKLSMIISLANKNSTRLKLFALFMTISKLSRLTSAAIG